MARNVLGGKSKAVLGLKELGEKLSDLASIQTGDNRGIRNAVHDMLRDAGGVIKKRGQANAKARGWPQRTINSFFTFSDPNRPVTKGQRNALVGVNKQMTMIAWTAGRNPKSPNAKVSPGGQVAESLASMFEFGTSKMAAKPAFRPAVTESRGEVRNKVVNGLQEIITGVVNKRI